MADDYSYQQTKLRPKPDGPYGFGGKASAGFGSRTTQGIGDAGPGGGMGMAFFGSGSSGGGFYFGGGYELGGGSPGGTDGGSAGGGGGSGGGGGGGSSLPGGIRSSLLWHNGESWTATVAAPGSDQLGAVFMNARSSYYQVPVPAADNHVFGVVDGKVTWIPIQECG